MSIEEAGVQGAKLQLECVIEESKLKELLEEIERLELENVKLADVVESKQDAESKVFTYLNSKVLDSMEQLNYVENNFITRRKLLESTTREVKSQIQDLENHKNKALKEVEDENQALRDNIKLFEGYEKELPSLDEKITELEECLRLTRAKHEEAMEKALKRNEFAKQNAHIVAKAEVEVIAQRALEECDANLDLKTKACLEENQIIEQELKHQVQGSKELEARVVAIEAENATLRQKLQQAQVAEASVAKLMHLKQQEFKDVKAQLELSHSSQQLQNRRISGSSSLLKIWKNQVKRSELATSNVGRSRNENQHIYDGDDDLNIILRQQLKDSLKVKAQDTKKLKDRIRESLQTVKVKNEDLESKVNELRDNLQSLLELQQEDKVVTSTLEVTEDICRQSTYANLWATEGPPNPKDSFDHYVGGLGLSVGTEDTEIDGKLNNYVNLILAHVQASRYREECFGK